MANMTLAEAPPIPPSTFPRKAASTISTSAIRCLTRFPACSAEAPSSTPSPSRPLTFPAASTSDRRPSTAMPSPSMPRTRGRSRPACCSTTACATSSTRRSPSAPREPPASLFPTPPLALSSSSSSIPSLGIASISTAWDRASNSIGWPSRRSTSAPAEQSPRSRPIFSRTIRSPARFHLPLIPASPPRLQRLSRMASRSPRTSCRSPTRSRGRTFLPTAPRLSLPTPSWI